MNDEIVFDFQVKCDIVIFFNITGVYTVHIFIYCTPLNHTFLLLLYDNK